MTEIHTVKLALNPLHLLIWCITQQPHTDHHN